MCIIACYVCDSRATAQRTLLPFRAFETFAVFATAAMLDLITLVSAVGLQQELKKAEQSEVIREDHQDMDFLGSAAEQISVAIDSFESFLSQGLDMLKEEEKAPVKKA